MSVLGRVSVEGRMGLLHRQDSERAGRRGTSGGGDQAEGEEGVFGGKLTMILGIPTFV